MASINEILENMQPEDEKEISRCNCLFSQLENPYDLHGQLSFKALENFYRNRSKFQLADSAKEHIIFKYLSELVDNGMISDPLLTELIHLYYETKYLAVESILVRLIKNKQINQDQANTIHQHFKDSEIQKQIFLYSIREQIKESVCFDEKTILKLLNYQAYDMLNQILDLKMIDKNALALFQCPVFNENFYKKKKTLYTKAQNLMNL